MKKLLSLVLAMLMILSTVSFAAPAMVGSVAEVTENVAEVAETVADVTVQEDVANLAAESDYGTLVYDVDFDNPTETVIYKDGNSNVKTIDKYGKVNLPEGFPAISNTKLAHSMAEATLTIKDGVVNSTATGNPKWPSLIMVKANSVFPEGKYTVVCDVKQTSQNTTTGYTFRVRVRGGVNAKGDTDLGVSPQSTAKYNETVNYVCTYTWKDKLINGKDSYTAMKEIHVYMDSKGTDTFQIDNFKVYYKPLPKVSVNVNGNSAFENVAPYSVYEGTKITLDDLKATYGYADTEDMYFLGMSTSPNGYLVDSVTVNEDTTIYLKWKAKNEIVYKDSKNGELLFLVDFNAVPASKVKTLDTIGEYIYDVGDNAAFPTSDKVDFSTIMTWKKEGLATVGWNTQGVTGLKQSNGIGAGCLIFETESDGNVAVKTRMGKERAQLQLTNYLGFNSTHGVYTLVYDAKTNIPDSKMSSISPSLSWFAFPDGVQTPVGKTWTSPKSNTWVRDVELVADYDSASKLTAIMFGAESLTADATAYDFYYDNIRLYWKPFTVNVTIDANGNSEAKNVVYTADTSKKVSVSALKALMSNTDSKMFIGVSLTPDGELLREDFWASEDTTIYARWADYAPTHEQHGQLLFLMDFDNIDKKSSIYSKDDSGREFILENKAIGGAAFINPAIKDFDATNNAFDTESCKSYNGASSQSFLLGTESNGNGYASLYAQDYGLVFTWLNNVTSKPTYKRGNYTVVYDVNSTNVITGYYNRYKLNYMLNGAYAKDLFENDITFKVSERLEANKWHKDFAYVVPHSLVAAKSTEEKTYEDIAALSLGITTAKGSTVKYDNLRVYWKPVSASITINMNGNADKTVEAYANDTSSKLSLAELAKHVGEETANYTLKGFSKTSDGELLTEDIWANEDTTLYAVWEEKTVVTPASYDVSSIRTDAYTGIRFKASVTKAQKEEVTEYGFIVTLENLLGDKELTHTSGVTYVEGINYSVVDGKNVDKIYEIVDDDIFFTAVVYGIPETKSAYESDFIVRPFTKRDGYYYYGNPVERSVYSVAKAIREGGYANLKESEIAKIKSILTICEE